MTKEDRLSTICELIHETAIHFKDGLITHKQAERRIDHLLKKLDEVLKQ